MRRHAGESRREGNADLKRILITLMKSSSPAGRHALNEEVPKIIILLLILLEMVLAPPPLKILISTSEIRIRREDRAGVLTLMGKTFMCVSTLHSKRPSMGQARKSSI